MIAHFEFIIVQVERLALVLPGFELRKPNPGPLRFQFLLSK